MDLEQTIKKAYNAQKVGNFQEAEETLELAAKLWPDNWLPYFDLGCLKTLLRKYSEAEACLAKAEQLECDMPAALLHNRGWLYRKMGRIDEAIPLYEQAIEIDPDFAEAHNNLGICLMLKGRSVEGLEKLEYRFKTNKELTKVRERFDAPDWKGERFVNKTLLIYNEQGRGDAIQNFRYLPLVKSYGGKVILECREELVRLFQACTSVKVIPKQAKAEYDLVVSINSLSYIFDGRIPQRFSDQATYLTHEGTSLELPSPRYWDRYKDKFKVGIAWAGSARHPEDDIRSIPASMFRRLQSPEVELFSFQVNPKGRPELYDSGFYNDLDPVIGDFQDTANLICEMDLIVSVDTAIAHLAGAMEKAVWTVVPEIPDYRWGLGTVRTPWYKTMLLCRKQASWEDLFDIMGDSIASFAHSHG